MQNGRMSVRRFCRVLQLRARRFESHAPARQLQRRRERTELRAQNGAPATTPASRMDTRRGSRSIQLDVALGFFEQPDLARPVAPRSDHGVFDGDLISAGWRLSRRERHGDLLAGQQQTLFDDDDLRSTDTCFQLESAIGAFGRDPRALRDPLGGNRRAVATHMPDDDRLQWHRYPATRGLERRVAHDQPRLIAGVVGREICIERKPPWRRHVGRSCGQPQHECQENEVRAPTRDGQKLGQNVEQTGMARPYFRESRRAAFTMAASAGN